MIIKTEEELREAQRAIKSYIDKVDQTDYLTEDLEKYFENNNVSNAKILKFGIKRSFYNHNFYTIEIYEPEFDENFWDDKAKEDVKKIGDKYDINLYFDAGMMSK